MAPSLVGTGLHPSTLFHEEEPSWATGPPSVIRMRLFVFAKDC